MISAFVLVKKAQNSKCQQEEDEAAASNAFNWFLLEYPIGKCYNTQGEPENQFIFLFL